MSSFIAPENKAIVQAVRESYDMQTLLAGKLIYNGIAPLKVPYPYLTLSLMTERERSLMMQQGAEGRININIWDYGSALLRITEIYGALNVLLHNNRLPLDAGHVIRCKVELIHTGAGDQLDPKILRGIAQCSIWALGPN